MKYLLSLQQYFHYTTGFSPLYKASTQEVDWVDKEKKLANGKMYVRSIEVFVQEVDKYGNGTGMFKKVFLDKEDMFSLVDKVREIESGTNTGYIDNDLPW